MNPDYQVERDQPVQSLEIIELRSSVGWDD